MNSNTIVLLTVTICLLLTFGAVLIVTLAKEKKWDLTGAVTKLESLYGTAETVAAAIAPFLPAPYNGYVTLVFEVADKAVHIAEAAWKAGTCEKDKRKDKATLLIREALEAQNIEIDAKTENLIDIATEVMVKTLPKSN